MIFFPPTLEPLHRKDWNSANVAVCEVWIQYLLIHFCSYYLAVFLAFLLFFSVSNHNHPCMSTNMLLTYLGRCQRWEEVLWDEFWILSWGVSKLNVCCRCFPCPVAGWNESTHHISCCLWDPATETAPVFQEHSNRPGLRGLQAAHLRARCVHCPVCAWWEIALLYWVWKPCAWHSNLFVMAAASMSEQKSALELNLSCAFRIWVCFLPEWINRVLFKGMLSFSVKKRSLVAMMVRLM